MKKIIIFLFAVFVFCSCSMQNYYVKMDNLLSSGNCTDAAVHITTNEGQYGQNANLLYLMDSAMVNMMCGNYKEGNTFYHEAETLGEELWTKSVSQYALSMVTNDLVIQYAGEDFERALINLFSAISYLRLEEYDEALVECRRLDSLLSLYNTKYEKKNVYKEDAFGRYLSGIIHESVNELDDAYIDYYTALKIYRDYNGSYGTPTPTILKEDFLRIAKSVGRVSEARKHVSGFSQIRYPKKKDLKNKGKIVFIHFNGKSPVKVEKKFVVNTHVGPLSIAFPTYVVQNATCKNTRLIVESGSERLDTGLELVEDINRIAVKSLEDRKARIWAKAIARAVAKQVAINKAADKQKDKGNKQLLKMVLNAANTLAVEKADTRTWRTLPGEIYIGRMFVSEGDYEVSAQECGMGKRFIEPLKIRAGETKFVILFSRI